MKRLLLMTVLLIPVYTPVQAQKSQTLPTPQAQVVKPESRKDASASIREGLNDVFGQLSQSLKDADALAGRLKDMAAKTPGDVANQITQAEETMGNLADKLGPEGSLSGELHGLRDAAQKHLERIQKLPGEFLDDEDRTRLLNSWQKVIQDADSASGNMSMMREQIGTALMKLRRKEAAVSEMLLVNQYQAAVKALSSWTSELQTTLGNLHRLIDANKPVS